MALLPKVKLKALVSFPATVLDGVGIDVAKSNGNYQFNLDFSDFAPPVAGVSDAAHQNALLWNSVTGQYILAPVSVIGAGGSVPEAPVDGVQYGRQSLTWTPVVSGIPSNTVPLVDGTGAPGVATAYSRGDHVHPTDTTRAPLASPTFTGDPKAPTPSPGDNDTSIATTAFVTAAVATSGTPSNTNPLMNGAAAPGTAIAYSRGDHIHPSDTSRQPLDDDLTAISALSSTGLARRTGTGIWTVGGGVANAELAAMAAFTFKGNNTTGPAAPTDVDIGTLTTKASPAGGDYLLVSDQAASGAWKKVAISSMPGSSGGIAEAPNDGQQYARQSLGWTVVAGGGGASPSNATPAMNGAAAAGSSLLYSRGDHIHPTDTTRQPLDAELSAIAGLVSAADQAPYFTGSGTASLMTVTAAARTVLDDTTTAAMLTTLGAQPALTPAALTRVNDANVTLTLGGTPASALLQATSITAGWSGTLATNRGGFGADVSAANGVPLFAAGAPTFTPTTGTGNVVLASSPTLTGDPKAPTPTAGDNDTSIATTAFVTSAIATSGGSSVLVADTAPVGAPDRSLWWESDTGNLYIRYNDGTSTQWVLVMPQASAAAISAVTYTAQTLSAPQQVQARQNIYAAPFDALAYNGMQINGGMQVSQEKGTTAITGVLANSVYAVDGWRVSNGGTNVLSAQQVTDAPPGYSNSLKLSVTTASASLAVGDYATLQHQIEGYRASRLAWGTTNAQPLTIGIWVKANRAGTYSGTVINGAANRSYMFSFVITTSLAWQFITTTIPGDTAGAWTSDNTTGLYVIITLAAGTTYISPPGVWTAGFFLGVAGTTNGVAATTDTFQITGVVVVPGIEAPSAARAPFIMRPYDQELLTCQRHFEMQTKLYYGAAFANAPSAIRAVLPYQQKRAAPSISFGGTMAFNTAGSLFTISSPGSILAEASGQFFFQGTTTGAVPGQGGMLMDSAASFIKIDARL